MEIFTIILRIQKVVIVVQFCGVPAHVGEEGNEKVDEIAKRVLELNDDEIMKVPIGKGEAKLFIREAVKDSWQSERDTDIKGRHCYRIEKSIKLVGFSRIKIGHTGLKSTLYFLAKCISDTCAVCNVPENVEHVIKRYSKYNSEGYLRDKIDELGQDGTWKGF